jgi:cellulose synthase/poly-beta-1,6-N-acetylglucosamine synthase-like glycosyltransferase
LHFPEFEIIVVNDGSTDKTLETLIREFNLVSVPSVIRLVLNHKPIRNLYISLDHPNLTVVDKVNGGKADALNAGINASQYPLFCCIDADSILEPDALLRASRIFLEDKEVIATGGVVLPLNGCKVEGGAISKVETPKKFVELMQAVEYTRGFLAGRTGWSIWKSLLIISGAFGVFRKDMVLAVGGYRNTVGEDMDLVVRLHKYCLENNVRYKILFIPDPVCYTQVPSDLKSLLRQRNRWHRGLIDSLIYSKKMFFNPKYGVVGLLGFPYFVFVEALGPLIEFSGYFGFVLFYFFGLLSKEFAFLFFSLAFIWGMWINVSAVFLDNFVYKRYKSIKDILKLCIGGIIEFFGYRQLIAAERIIATFQFWKKSWGKPKRERLAHEIPVKINK